MKPLSIANLATILAAFAVVGAIVLTVFPTLMFTPVTGILFAAIAIVLFFLGRRVLAFRKGEDSRMTSLGAMNVAMFARSSAWVGAGTAGFFLGAILTMLPNTHAHFIRMSMLGAIISAAGAVVLVVIGIIVERWCQLDDDEGASSGGEQGA